MASDTPALKNNPKFIFFTDFDGTVTTADSNDYMTDNLGFGVERRRQLNKDVLFGNMHFRDSFVEMLDSIKTPFNECVQILLKNIKLDPGFKEFYDWAQQNNVPIVILSGGMEPVIRALLDTLLGPGWDIQIVSNDVKAREGKTLEDEGGWRIEFHDDRYRYSVLCHCNQMLTPPVSTVMTSLSRSASTLRYPTDLPCSTLVTVFPISLPPKRLTCCLPRPIWVRIMP